MTESSVVRTTADGPVLNVVLDRPKANAIDAATSRELSRVFVDFRDDPDLRVAVLTGVGERFFSAGWDLGAAANGEDFEADYGEGGFGGFCELPDRHKPVICAVNGMAVGGGFEIAMAAEFVVAAEHATFFDPHVTYGMPAVYEPMKMLGLMPFGEVMRMSLTGNGERISAASAREMGLVSEVVPSNQLAEAADRLARTIAANPPWAVQGTLRSIWAARDLGRLGSRTMAASILSAATDKAALASGAEGFSSGERTEPRIR